MTEPNAPFAMPPGLPTPIPVIDLDRMQANIEHMSRELEARNVALRPHFKTPKMVEVAHRELEAGAVGLTCATIGEAEILSRNGVRDIFIAYPVWVTPDRQARLAAIVSRLDRLAVGVDSREAATQLQRAFQGSGAAPGVLIEVDCGDLRTGVEPDEAGPLGRFAADLGLAVDGVFTHGGHGYDPNGREAAADDEVESLTLAVDSFRRYGLAARIVSAGATPTVPRSARGVVTEERPGTFVFGDRQQVALGSCRSEDVALQVAATVVSTAVPGQFVLDSGAKSLGKDRPTWLHGHGYVPAYPNATISRIFDHHAVCELPAGTRRPAVGEILAVVPNHVCAVVNLSRSVVVTQGGRAIDTWSVVAAGAV